MLTEEASADRYWLGTKVLREVLEPKRARYEETLYYISTAEGPADHARRVLHLAAMVAALRSAILESLIGSPEERRKRAKELLAELDDLRGGVAGVCRSAADLERAVALLQNDLYGAWPSEEQSQPDVQG